MSNGVGFDIFARDKTAQAFANVNNKVSGLNKKFDQLKGAVGGFAKLLAGGLAIRFFADVAENAAKIDDLSNRLKIGHEELSRFQFIAERGGVEIDAVASAMQKLGINAVKAAEGSNAQSEALQKLGIDSTNFKNLGMDQQFALIADKIQSVENPSERASLAMDLMGKSGVEMLQVMDGGGDAFLAMSARADELGVTMTKVQSQDMAAMMDAFDDVGYAVKGVAQDLVAVLAPAITWVVNKVTWAISQFQVFDGGMTKLGWKMVDLGHQIGIVSDETHKLATIEAWERINKGAKETNATLGEQEQLLNKINQSINSPKRERKSLNNRVKQSNKTLKKTFDEETDGLEEKVTGTSRTIKDTMAKQSKELAESVRADNRTIQDSAENVGDSWSDSIRNLSVDFNNLKGTALNALNAIGESILNNIVNKIGGGGASGGPITVGGLGDAAGNFLSEAFGDIGSILGFASGGDHTGGLRIVGENGPELEATGKSRIFNAGQTKSMLAGIGRGGDGNIQVVYNIDARGADAGVEQRVMRALQKMNATIESRSVAAVANAKQRNPNVF